MKNTDKKKKRPKVVDDVHNVGAALSANDAVQRGGDAQRAVFDTQNELNNLGQRGGPHGRRGFVYESIEKGRRNTDASMKGEDATWKRTDEIGRGNDPHDDLVRVENGEITNGYQLKFRGPKAISQNIESGGWDRYEKIMVPKNKYETVIREIDNKIAKVEASGDAEKLRYLQEGRAKIEAGKTNSGDVFLADKNPGLYTAKEALKVAGKAGIQAAAYSAVFGGTFSAALNMIAVRRGDKDLSEAMQDILKDTGKSAATGFGVAAGGSLVKGAMLGSKEAAIKALAKSSVPTMIAAATIETGKSFLRYFKGEIDGTELIEELGEKGTGMAASAYGATVGQALIPVPVLGLMIGGIVGYMINLQCYHGILSALKSAKLSEQRRIEAERMCTAAIKEIRRFRKAMNTHLDKQYFQRQQELEEAFEFVDLSIRTNNVDSLAKNIDRIALVFGQNLQFKNSAEFDAFMRTSEPLKL